MKTLSVLFTFLLLGTALVRAQASVPIDQQILTEIMGFRGEMNGTELRNLLQQQLDKATQQIDRLDKQLARTGDYAATNIPGVSNAQAALINAASPDQSTKLRTAAVLGAERDAITGEEVFTGDVAGVFKSIGATYTTKDGVVKNRDAATYKSDAKSVSNLKEFYRIRDTAVQKQTDLENARISAFDELLSAPDEVATQRLTAIISTLDAELIAVRQDIANASADLQAQERAASLQASVDAKAKNEATAADRAGGVTAAQIQEALARMPNGGMTGTHNAEYRLPFGAGTAPAATPPLTPAE